MPAVRPLHGLYLFETFIFGDNVTFDYPIDDEELESGVSLSQELKVGAAYVPVIGSCAAVAAALFVANKSFQKRAKYQSIKSTVGEVQRII